MSYLRTAAYLPAGAAVCRRMGHVWDGSRCAGCRLIRDDYTAPYFPGVSIHGGLPMGRMEPLMAPVVVTPRRKAVDDTEPCPRNHTPQWVRGKDGKRRCLSCESIRSKEYRERRAARMAA